jgi:hypothetical protein
MANEDLYGRRARRAENLRRVLTDDVNRQLSEMDKDGGKRALFGERFNATRLRREIQGLAPSISEGLWRAVNAFEKFDGSSDDSVVQSCDKRQEVQVAIEQVVKDMRSAMAVLDEANAATFYSRTILGRRDSTFAESREARARENWELLLRDTPPDNQGPESEVREYLLGDEASRRLSSKNDGDQRMGVQRVWSG